MLALLHTRKSTLSLMLTTPSRETWSWLDLLWSSWRPRPCLCAFPITSPWPPVRPRGRCYLASGLWGAYEGPETRRTLSSGSGRATGYHSTLSRMSRGVPLMCCHWSSEPNARCQPATQRGSLVRVVLRLVLLSKESLYLPRLHAAPAHSALRADAKQAALSSLLSPLALRALLAPLPRTASSPATQRACTIARTTRSLAC